MKIVLTGSLAVDQIMSFDGRFADLIQPEKLRVVSISVLIQELRRTRGGIAGNIAYSLALLGEKPVLFGSIGDDQKPYMNALSQMGVDTSLVHYSDKATATFTVLTDRDGCQVGGFYPGAMADAASLSLEQFKDEEILVVLSAHDPAQMKKQVQECKKLNKRLFYDVGQQAANIDGEDIKEGLEVTELLIVNDYEMGVLAKKTGLTEFKIREKVKNCVITLGEKGCLVYEDGQAKEIHACEIAQLGDPTGAGDAFRAGFLYGYLRNWSLTKSAQLGCVVGAYAVEKIGTQEHRFTQTELSERYQKCYQTALF